MSLNLLKRITRRNKFTYDLNQTSVSSSPLSNPKQDHYAKKETLDENGNIVVEAKLCGLSLLDDGFVEFCFLLS
jgi:hypothetical protein